MPGGVADIGTGASITFSSSFFAQVTNISWSGISRPAIDASHMGIAAAAAGKFGNKLFLAGELVDPGELSVDMHFNPILDPPIASAAEPTTLTFPKFGSDSTSTSYAGSGFLTQWEFTVPMEELMTASATIKFSGNITITDAT